MLGLTITKSMSCSAGGVIAGGSCGNDFMDVRPESRARPAAAEGRLCEWQELHPAVRMNLSLCFSSNAREVRTVSGMERLLILTGTTLAVALPAGDGGSAPSNRAASVWPRLAARALAGSS